MLRLPLQCGAVFPHHQVNHYATFRGQHNIMEDGAACFDDLLIEMKEVAWMRGLLVNLLDSISPPFPFRSICRAQEWNDSWDTSQQLNSRGHEGRRWRVPEQHHDTLLEISGRWRSMSAWLPADYSELIWCISPIYHSYNSIGLYSMYPCMRYSQGTVILIYIRKYIIVNT